MTTLEISKVGKLVIILVISILILLVILLPLSFTVVQYDEYVIFKNKFTNRIDTDNIYTNGRYYILPHYSSISFPKKFQSINFDRLSVADKDQKRFFMKIKLFYKLSINSIPRLYSNYGLNYNLQIQNIAESTIKNFAPKFALNSYLQNRNLIVRNITSELYNEFNTIGLEYDVNKFYIDLITLESTTIDKYLSIAIQKQQNDQKKYEQDAELIRIETIQLTEQFDAESTFIIRSSNATAVKMIETAKAESFKINTIARSNGIKNLSNALNITSENTLNNLIYIMAVQDNLDNIKFVPNNIIISN